MKTLHFIKQHTQTFAGLARTGACAPVFHIQSKAKSTASFLKKSGVFAIALCASLLSLNTQANTPANTLIENTAYANYSFNSQAMQVSATDRFYTTSTQTPARSPAVITLMHNSLDFDAQFQTAQNASGNSLTTSSPSSVQSRTIASSNGQALSGTFPVSTGRCATDETTNSLVAQAAPQSYQGNTLTLPGAINLRSDEYFKVGDTIFTHLNDQDQNLDPNAIENIVVTLLSENGLDKETIELTETGNNTGLFTGYVQSVDIADVAPTHFDCQLSVKSESSLQASYQDQFDEQDLVRAGALFDPNSYVVNADTGEYVNGIEVTLIDADTNLPANILSDEGGIFPSTVTTGGSVTDSKGNVYQFPYGGFAFPVVDAGDYRIQIGESPYYDYPISTQKSLADINALTNGPFNFDEQGSRALAFNSGITFRMDVPLDPKDNTVLLTKTANKNSAGIGELVAYRIQIENTEIPGTNIKIEDRLPQGFRYVAGSAQLNGNQLVDPTISADGQLLSFNIGDLAVEESLTLQYLTRISVNTPVGTAINSAWLIDQEDIANEGVLESNTTKAAIEIQEDLFANSTRLFGRVYIGSCNGEQQVADEGLSDVRIYLENGTYVVTDEDGFWHIEDQKPGTHVVQLDTDTLPKYLDLMACENYGQHAGREYSQFVDLQPGSFWRTDFVVKLKPPSKGQVTQRLSSRIEPVTERDKSNAKDIALALNQKIVYRVDLTGTGVKLKDLRSLIMLPPGVSYKTGSATLDGNTIQAPKKYDEQTLLFSLNDPGEDWGHLLEFEAWITEQAKAGELSTRSVAMFDSPSEANQRTPVAITSALLSLVPENKEVHKPEEAPKFSSFSRDLSQADINAMKSVLEQLRGLEDLRIEVAGHTDNVPIAKRSRHIFNNNYELSLARARSAADYLMRELELGPEQVTISGYGSQRPVTNNGNEQSRALNRRVEVNILAARDGLKLAKADSGDQMVATLGIAPGGFDFPLEATASGPVKTEVQMPEFDKAYLAQSNNEFEWLWPGKGYLPNIPSTKVAIKHPLKHKIQLRLNGEPVSQLNFVKKETYKPNQSAISLWSGVDLKEGNNVFIASLVDDQGNILERKKYQLHYAGSPTRVELVEEKTKAVADGVVAPVVAVKLFDKDGYPVRDGLQGEFNVAAPYQALDPNRKQTQINRQDFKPNYEISDDGIAYITLEPTTQAGEALITFPLANGRVEEVRVWLSPQNRDWMLIALGEGTIGYNDISGHIQNAKNQDVEDEFYTDGRLALFAKGQVAGDWLITAAYDSAKGKTTPFERLLDPNKYYTLYGDNSEQKLDASMEGKLYLRVEKRRFYTVFGDFNTDLNETELAQYLRKFHGIQTVYQGDLVSLNAFATESAQRFVRDEIQGDGTSGLYQLSNSDIITNSETISIQVRDRFRSEVILSEIELVKDADYSIDYIDGTIFFKNPIQSTDESFNPRYIIARYETENSSSDDITFGGRAAVHVLDKRVEVGASLIQEELGTEKKTLSALDMRLQINDQLEIKAETANTRQESDSAEASDAKAHYLELDYRGDQLQSKAYVRREEAGYGLGQLNESESGTEKLGIEGTYYLTSQHYIDVLVSDQKSLGNDLRQTLAEVKLNREYDLGRYHFGARVNENQANAESQSTQQLLAGHSFSLANGDWLLNTDAEINVKRNDDVYDLIRLGSDYRINEYVTLFATHETGFESDAPKRSVAGLRATPWQGMQVSNSVERQYSKDGSRLFAVHGLNQDINLDEHWQISFGFDQSRDLENSVVEQSSLLNNNVLGSGSQQSSIISNSEDFYAISLGWGYRSPTWQWTNRFEYREATDSDKWNILTGLYRPVAMGLSMGINGEYRLDEGESTETEFKQIEFNIGLRPMGFGLAWLNQSRLIEESITGNNDELISERIVNNTHLNMRWNKTQISSQYGFKYVEETLLGNNYSGFIDLIGLELRHHITPRWDWGLHGQRLNDYELDDVQYRTGLSIGFIPRVNTWVSLGYNLSGFTDSDFSGADYSAQGIYLKLRIKADQDSMRALKAYFE
ncbi:hypothetical protein RED65_11730 [Oceanobacter sp. RED65]|uniref:OmpA-like domain-containing protein n=1 Tax=Bermanella marisrubri TaxID=207949 RepID=Q1N142_9GAMM|nr:hypothetical protein RED65_11730 [Oceanobacter sp. RED65] [Bermanella marisrubri]